MGGGAAHPDKVKQAAKGARHTGECQYGGLAAGLPGEQLGQGAYCVRRCGRVQPGGLHQPVRRLSGCHACAQRGRQVLAGAPATFTPCHTLPLRILAYHPWWLLLPGGQLPPYPSCLVIWGTSTTTRSMCPSACLCNDADYTPEVNMSKSLMMGVSRILVMPGCQISGKPPKQC